MADIVRAYLSTEWWATGFSPMLFYCLFTNKSNAVFFLLQKLLGKLSLSACISFSYACHIGAVMLLLQHFLRNSMSNWSGTVAKPRGKKQFLVLLLQFRLISVTCAKCESQRLKQCVMWNCRILSPLASFCPWKLLGCKSHQRREAALTLLIQAWKNRCIEAGGGGGVISEKQSII